MSQTEKILIDTLHTLLCDTPHAGNMAELAQRQDEKCYYYLEECLTECDEMDDHRFWIGQAQQLKTMLGTDDPSSVLNSIYRVLDLLEKLSMLSSAEQELFELLHTNR